QYQYVLRRGRVGGADPKAGWPPFACAPSPPNSSRRAPLLAETSGARGLFMAPPGNLCGFLSPPMPYRLAREEHDVIKFLREGPRSAAGARLASIQNPDSWLGERHRSDSCPYRIGKMPKRPFNTSGRFA